MLRVSEHPEHLPCRIARTVAAFKKLLREAATNATHPQDTGSPKSRKCLIFFGLRGFEVGSMWRAKSRSLSHQRRSDTYCGNVNPHRRAQVDAPSGLQTHLYVPVGGLLVAAAEQRSRRARREPPPNQQVLGAQCLHDRAEPAAEVADLGRPLAE